MKIGEICWRLVELAAVLLTAAAPAYFAYDLWTHGPTPEKQLELRSFVGINPLQDLSALGERATLSFHVEDQTIDNLVIGQSYITNIGNAPILPTDYVQPLSVSVKKPWKIVAVASDANSLQLQWKRFDDSKFEAVPALINPGDSVDTYVYLTNAQAPLANDLHPAKPPEVAWGARIVNLRSFTEPPDRFQQAVGNRWIVIELEGWGVPFTLFAALLFEALYLRLLSAEGLLHGWGARTIVIVLATGLLSVVASGCIAKYLFGDTATALDGTVNHWVNAPPIILHIVVLSLLYSRLRTLRRVRNSA